MENLKKIFVVGSSRSGTTMMGRILAKNALVFTFRELHFFGGIWTKNQDKELPRKDQINLLSRLLSIQENGIFHKRGSSDFDIISEGLLDESVKTPLEIYELFLETITTKNAAQISCEQTPKNLYYIEEIISFFPDAKVINLVRDQRDVLLSQKNKWRRRFLGAKEIPLLEALRAYINYHPILTSKVWNSSLLYTSRYLDHSNVKIIKFEDLLSNPEGIVKEICKFVDIDFQHEMLEVPIVGSSTEDDIRDEQHIDKSKINKWKEGGLTNGEIYLSQKFSFKMMDKFGYQRMKFSLPPLYSVFYLITFPVKLCLAFLFNIHRMGNIAEVIQKRFFIK